MKRKIKIPKSIMAFWDKATSPNNLKIIIDYDENRLLREKSIEEYVGHKFKKAGFKILKNPEPHEWGHPDYTITDDIDILYVEVKGPYDTLRLTQLKWILNNPDKKVILYYLLTPIRMKAITIELTKEDYDEYDKIQKLLEKMDKGELL